MESPQIEQQVISPEPIRLADMALMAGPREIEFEIELPKGSTWDLGGSNEVTATSAAPEVVATGETRFDPNSMRFMIPVSALRAGEAALVYDISVCWTEKGGQQCCDKRQVVQRVLVDTARGATVPWVHYKAKANQ
jgi:hypothetical protein